MDGGVVGPVQVVEQQRDRPLARERLEQPAQRAVLVEALDGRRDRVELGGDGGQHRAQRRVQRLDPALVQRGDVVVEGVDGDAEGHVALMLGAAALEHEQPGALRPRGSAASSAVLPSPPSPSTPSTRLVPVRTASTASATALSSASRPTSFIGNVTARGAELFPGRGVSL